MIRSISRKEADELFDATTIVRTALFRYEAGAGVDQFNRMMRAISVVVSAAEKYAQLAKGYDDCVNARLGCPHCAEQIKVERDG
jgi:hypothetical protein